MATFVLVHGAWSGGWCYGKVAALLRARGHTVFTPTLTGRASARICRRRRQSVDAHRRVLGVFDYED